MHETVRRVMSAMINDVIAETHRRARALKVHSSADVRALGEPLVAFSAQMRENNRVLQSFLTRRMYKHPRVMETMDRARRLVRDLFEAYMGNEALVQTAGEEPAATGHARRVCDYIAGMTDRYVMHEYQRHFGLGSLS